MSDGRGLPDEHEPALGVVRRETLVDVHRHERRARVEHRRQRAHERREQPRDDEAAQPRRQQRADQRRQRAVRVGERELAALREHVRDDAGHDEDEERQQLQGRREERRAPRLADRLRRERPLHDVLIRAPVPDGEDRRAEQDARPREIGVRRRAPQAHELRRRGRAQLAPAADGVEADDRDDDGAADHDEHLEHVGHEHRAHAADDGVDARREHDDDGARPEVDAHQRLEHDAAGGDRHGDLRQHVADDRDRGEIEAHARRIPRFEELGHREHAASADRTARTASRAAAARTTAMSSNCAAGNAPEAPLPASPTRCSEPMFVAKIEAPTMNQPALRPARKNSVGFARFAALWRNTTA